jgi:hypothetical protein
MLVQICDDPFCRISLASGLSFQFLFILQKTAKAGTRCTCMKQRENISWNTQPKHIKTICVDMPQQIGYLEVWPCAYVLAWSVTYSFTSESRATDSWWLPSLSSSAWRRRLSWELKQHIQVRWKEMFHRLPFGASNFSYQFIARPDLWPALGRSKLYMSVISLSFSIFFFARNNRVLSVIQNLQHAKRCSLKFLVFSQKRSLN